MPDDWNSWLFSVDARVAIAGAAGGIVRWLTLRERLWPDGVITVGTGSLCAIYLGELAVPLLAPLMGIVAENSESAAQDAAQLGAFLMGIGGVTAAGFLIDVWNAKRRDVSGKEDGDE